MLDILASRGPFGLHDLGMRAVIQRVTRAEVKIGGIVAGEIDQGLVVLVAVHSTDSAEDIEWLSGKILRVRIFDDAVQVMNRSVMEIGGGILVVSQFTLLASTRKGNRPSYSQAAPPDLALPLYEAFLERLNTHFGRPVACGRFGAQMEVSLVNDGPVTLVMDTKLRE